MQRRQLLVGAGLGAGLVSLNALSVARAQAYPDQPIKWIVPYPAGGGTDALARALGEVMKTTLGQPIVVDNRPGAATNIAADLVAKSRADGYTIMSADNALMAFNEHLFKKLPFDPEKDFTYVGAIGRFPLALVVHPGFPAQDFKAFLAHVRANPGKVNYASPGNGSPHHLAMEMFKLRTKTDLVHVPYKGAAPAMQDVMGGQVPVMFLDLAAGLGAITGGKVRALAIGTNKRAPSLPNVPTLAESGVSDAEVFAFQGIVGPAGLPAPVVQKVNAELNKAMQDAGIQKRFADIGMAAMPISANRFWMPGTPDQFRAMARSESKRWGPVIKAAGVSLD